MLLSYDFCVADLQGPDSPSGYQCKPPKTLTVDDFVFSSFVAGNTTNIFKAVLTSAFVYDFPGVNGLGLSVGRLDIEKGFMTPFSLFTKTLKPGDVMVIPQGQLHFQVNSGNRRATAFLACSSPNREAQLLDLLLFSNSLPSDLVAQTTFLDVAQVKKLKVRFGGRG
ncbi:unnamed protein product [Sphenostylis stenocarpa]|uniref:Germin-like protein n=1 Tax=Sphenostylis stenocarpa TaxID=92480 RepID=A0AA86SBG6_9FABA|nr:unnamed protein product [Sphenostylis stenocarpa]